MVIGNIAYIGKEGAVMPVNFEILYFYLFNRVTDALEALEAGRTDEAREALIEAQRRTEGMYIEESREENP